MMPEMDGLDMVKAIKENKEVSHIPIILLSAKSSLDDRIKGLEYGIDDYITKPFSSTYLKTRIKNLLKQREELQQKYLSELTLEGKISKTDLSPSLPQITSYDEDFLKQVMDFMENNMDNPDLTTAPGEGICIANYPVVVDASNVIIRYLRFRMGDDAGIEADALEGRKQQNVIIDHCSVSWSTDECASFYDNKDFTMQWCIISESLRLSSHSKGPHGYGAIWGGVNATFHHNLMAHHDSRTPRFGPGVTYAGTDRVDLVNNVFYNWSGNGCYSAEAVSINMVNNYYKAGPATDNKIKNQIIGINVKTDPNDFPQIYQQAGKYYITGNYFPHSTEVTNDNWKGVNNSTGYPNSDIISTTPITIDNKISYSQTAQQAYEKVLQFAGCSHHRDEIDERIVRETREGTANYIGLSEYNGLGGEWKSANHPKQGIIDSHYDIRPVNASADWSPWVTLKSEEAPLDTDGDGIPDEWEIANGLDPKTNDANGRHLSTGYDNIEVYINSLVQEITEGQNK